MRVAVFWLASAALCSSLLVDGDEDGPSVIIAGGGTIGLSTAWHLAQSPKRYSSIIILDPFSQPAYPSAGYDINKIVRTDYPQAILAQIAQEAVDIWNTSPIFKDVWHNTGYVVGTFESAPYKSWNTLMNNTIKYTDASELEIFGINATDVYEERWPYFFEDGPPPSFISGFNGIAGWVDAADAQKALADHLSKDKRVHFISGPRGTVKNLVKCGSKVVGVETVDTHVHKADIVVIAMGAWSNDIIDFGQQAAPGFSFVTKIELDEEEYEQLKDIPVVSIEGPGNLDSQVAGYFFPPNKDRLLKIVAKVKGHLRYAYYDSEGNFTTVLPKDAHEPLGMLTMQDVVDYRQLIRIWLPQLGSKPFTQSNACWDLATFDAYWIIGPHPSSPENLFIATGGNGHTFKNLPNVGKYVVQSIEGTLAPELVEAFRWRPDRAVGPTPQLPLDFSKVEVFVKDGEEP